MQIQAENFRLFSNLINQSNEIMILVGKDGSTDALAAALYFENLLSSLIKNVQVVTKSQLPEGLGHLANKISKKIEPSKLIVSFNWHKNEIDKVSYQLDGEKFNFIVNPRTNKIPKEEVKIFHQGKEADLVITLGVPSLVGLDSYEREFIQNRTIVNIDNSSENQMFGRLNIVNEEADSICSLVVTLTEKNRLAPSPEAADLLLFGIRKVTNNFTEVRDSATFEAAAFCTKAKKGQINYQEKKQPDVKARVPSDWLSPKVFRSKHQAS
ncbi:MAG: hypothetical protein A2Z11_03605 [Candidatus Woykebacteria bacterium RBG_16_43_9]|uniref:DDH domain-containing protein n=1 Tax=Candidatus Woykebacteria bacterium RBG_16_43_9 TaxID=1802596 RepID=A0A1G1WDY2_9BACT|nr:MAG: hypothetical protein A2Z11_03605 [Candidatus Woykebacteria bacterium RBG_16_43_9]